MIWSEAEEDMKHYPLVLSGTLCCSLVLVNNDVDAVIIFGPPTSPSYSSYVVKDQLVPEGGRHPLDARDSYKV